MRLLRRSVARRLPRSRFLGLTTPPVLVCALAAALSSNLTDLTVGGVDADDNTELSTSSASLVLPPALLLWRFPVAASGAVLPSYAHASEAAAAAAAAATAAGLRLAALGTILAAAMIIVYDIYCDKCCRNKISNSSSRASDCGSVIDDDDDDDDDECHSNGRTNASSNSRLGVNPRLFVPAAPVVAEPQPQPPSKPLLWGSSPLVTAAVAAAALGLGLALGSGSGLLAVARAALAATATAARWVLAVTAGSEGPALLSLLPRHHRPPLAATRSENDNKISSNAIDVYHADIQTVVAAVSLVALLSLLTALPVLLLRGARAIAPLSLGASDVRCLCLLTAAPAALWAAVALPTVTQTLLTVISAVLAVADTMLTVAGGGVPQSSWSTWWSSLSSTTARQLTMKPLPSLLAQPLYPPLAAALAVAAAGALFAAVSLALCKGYLDLPLIISAAATTTTEDDNAQPHNRNRDHKSAGSDTSKGHLDAVDGGSRSEGHVDASGRGSRVLLVLSAVLLPVCYVLVTLALPQEPLSWFLSFLLAPSPLLLPLAASLAGVAAGPYPVGSQSPRGLLAAAVAAGTAAPRVWLLGACFALVVGGVAVAAVKSGNEGCCDNDNSNSDCEGDKNTNQRGCKHASRVNHKAQKQQSVYSKCFKAVRSTSAGASMNASRGYAVIAKNSDRASLVLDRLTVSKVAVSSKEMTVSDLTATAELHVDRSSANMTVSNAA